MKLLSASTKLLALLFSISFVFSSVSAQESKMTTNWMYEFVQLRTNAMMVKASGQYPEPQQGLLIVGGTPAGPTDNPFQVALLMRSEPNNFDAFYCGGTLIKPDLVVTAAHCSDFVLASGVQVLTGTRKLDGSGDRRNVSEINYHPLWNSATHDYDVAVWKLASNAIGVPLATLANNDGIAGNALLASGWGALSSAGSSPVDLQKVSVPLVSHSDCNAASSYNGKITQNMLCAGFKVGGRDACQGDSGGPLTRGRGNTVLTGITSWGIGCGDPNLYGVYTRVSIKSINDFIKQFM